MYTSPSTGRTMIKVGGNGDRSKVEPLYSFPIQTTATLNFQLLPQRASSSSSSTTSSSTNQPINQVRVGGISGPTAVHTSGPLTAGVSATRVNRAPERTGASRGPPSSILSADDSMSSLGTQTDPRAPRLGGPIGAAAGGPIGTGGSNGAAAGGPPSYDAVGRPSSVLLVAASSRDDLLPGSSEASQTSFPVDSSAQVDFGYGSLNNGTGFPGADSLKRNGFTDAGSQIGGYSDSGSQVGESFVASGSGFGSGSGSVYGSGSGSGPGPGSIYGSGTVYGSGSGSGNVNGSDSDSGNVYGFVYGSGSGSGNVNGSGSGSGNVYGSGSGSGSGSVYGSGSGNVYDSGSGSGSGGASSSILKTSSQSASTGSSSSMTDLWSSTVTPGDSSVTPVSSSLLKSSNAGSGGGSGGSGGGGGKDGEEGSEIRVFSDANGGRIKGGEATIRAKQLAQGFQRALTLSGSRSKGDDDDDDDDDDDAWEELGKPANPSSFTLVEWDLPNERSSKQNACHRVIILKDREMILMLKAACSTQKTGNDPRLLGLMVEIAENCSKRLKKMKTLPNLCAQHMDTLPLSDGRPTKDHLAALSKVLKDSVGIKEVAYRAQPTDDVYMGTFVQGTVLAKRNCAIGRVGVVAVLFKKSKYATVEAFSEQLCEHIAIAQPTTLGHLSDLDLKRLNRRGTTKIQHLQKDQLLVQNFIFDPTIIVAEAARRSFVRIEDFLLFH